MMCKEIIRFPSKTLHLELTPMYQYVSHLEHQLLLLDDFFLRKRQIRPTFSRDDVHAMLKAT